MSKQSLLLVDGDTRSLRVLEVSLRKAGFMVTAALSVQDALDKLELHAPDLIISETTFPDGDGFELRRRVRATPDWSEIPFIFLTAEAAIENKIRGLELGVDDYLTKPIYIKEIVTRINILLQKRQRTRFEERRDGRTRFAGRVQDMPVVDVIQTIEISRKSGVIQFVGERGRQAAIYFRDGRVIDAEAGTLQGEDAVYRLLTWSEGEFEVVFRTVRRREVITMSSQALLMEGMRRLDEWSRLFEQLPPLTHRFEIDTIELAARLGDVPDDNNRILRLVDGKRTLLEVIDASDVGDLECLQAISRLYFEELLIDLDHGRDSGKVVRRDTGRAVPTVSLGTPGAVGDEISGPVASSISISREMPAADVGEAAREATAAATGSAGPGRAAETPAAATPAGAAAATAAAASGAMSAPGAESRGEAGEASWDEGRERAAARGGEAGEASSAESGAESWDERGEASWGEAGEASWDEAGDDDRGDGGAEGGTGDDEAIGPLMGGYRPSSLRLIDEAVAAAQAIEPSLFDESPAAEPAAHEPDHSRVNGVARAGGTPSLTSDAVDSEDAPAAEAASPPETAAATSARIGLEPGKSLRLPGREDSGLRMIGSLGRDRAEASGELAAPGESRPVRSETARELVTILPRRATRELPVVPQELADSLPTPTPTSSMLVPRAASAAERGPVIPVEATQRIPRPGTGVRAPSRSRRLLRVVSSVQRSGPGLGAMILIVLAIVLAGTAVLLRLRRHAQQHEVGRDAPASSVERAPGGTADSAAAPDPALPGEPAAVPSPASADPQGAQVGAGVTPPSAAPEAGRAEPAPSAAAASDPSVARRAGEAGPPSAVTAGGGGAAAGSGSDAKPDGKLDRVGEAKVLCDRASSAIDEGDFEGALQLVSSSLKLRKTARAYVLRARAEQRLGRVDAALASLDAATDLAPTVGSVWEQRGRILWAARRRDEARVAFARFLELSPNSASAAEIERLLNEPR